MSSAKAEIEELERSGGASGDVLNRLGELKGLCEWAGERWVGLGEEVMGLEAEVAMEEQGGDGGWE